KSRAKAKNQLEEQSRALTTAVVDTLQLEPPEERNEESALALRLAREDQRIEGLPDVPIPVEPLLGIFPSNMPPTEAERAKQKANTALDARFAGVEKLLRREHATEERLEQFGEVYEAEKNERRLRWLKIFGSGSLLLGAAVALGVFVPAAIPILGRILAWLVSKVPALAGAVGVVSVKAFDAVVKGVERTKAASPEPSATSLGNERFDALPAPDGLLQVLHLNFSREMDAEHKALVRTRKGALGL
ncbi:MAG TPA: hypothetical protein VGR78_18150, partial [Verrucomicrobiae bacterium]|nr:hypothetical protein [Verrucomicrobiae bacterium]